MNGTGIAIVLPVRDRWKQNRGWHPSIRPGEFNRWGTFMKLLRILSIFFLVLLSGCATSTAQAPDLIVPSAGKAVVYVYRVDQAADTEHMVPNVRINNVSIGPLTRRGYFRVEVNPGSTQVALYVLDTGYETFWPVTQNLIVDLKLAPNSMHFVELSLNSMIVNFRETSRHTAIQRLSGMYLLN